MADDGLTVVRATGEVRTLRSRDVGSDVQAQKIDVGPWLPTVAGSASNQYSVTASSSAAVTLTVPSGFTHAMISVNGGSARMREDGVNPTTSSGLYLSDGFIGELALPNALRFIAVSTTVTIAVSYRKYV